MTILKSTPYLLAGLLLIATPYAKGDPPTVDQPPVKLAPIRDPQIMPPPEFDYEYSGHMTITRGDEASIRTECWGKSGIACAIRVSAETCFVWITDDDVLERRRLSYDMVLRHERAHCNGWKHPKK